MDLPTEGDKATIKKEVFKSFSSKTRYNIKVAEERGLVVEAYDKDNVTDEVLSRFHEIMVTTGKRDNFIVRHKEYFADMIDYLYPYCRLYMVKYSYKNDFERLSEKLKKQEDEKARALAKIETQKAKLAEEEDADKKSRIEKKIADQEKEFLKMIDKLKDLERK